MRKFFWQRWALMLLLVTRLVIGELGYAMPVIHGDDTGMAHASVAAEISTDAGAASSGHEGHRSMSASHHAGHSTADSSSTGSSTGADCCKSSECECPCMHVPCVALDAFGLKTVATVLLRTPKGLESFMSQRPSRLFRPPARIS